MPHLTPPTRITLGALSYAGLVLGGCATAASTGDAIIQKASLGRIQATPFSDQVLSRDCRAALDATYGFVRETRGMKNGVFVVQSFSCKADHIVAKVSLNNYTSEPTRCFAETESGVFSATIAPKASGFFEYSYASQAYQDCHPLIGPKN